MTLLLIFLIFFIMLLIPFSPGIIELVRPKDNSPLFIEMDYSKDPRYFGRSFKNILWKAITSEAGPGIREVTLSKNEIVEITSSKKIDMGKVVDHILYIIGDFISEEKARFNKEVYVKGNAVIGRKNILRAIACDGRLFLSTGVNIVRWADAEGKVEICAGCNLGISVSSGDELRIGKGCKFKRLYGMPLLTYSLESNTPDNCLDKEDISDTILVVNKDQVTIPPYTRIENDLIVRKDLKVRKGCVIIGSVKTYGDLVLERDINISGNLLSEGDIEIAENTTVSGDVFSQGIITIKKNVIIGSAERIKSVIGKKKIILGQNVTIYGYVLTEGSGIVI